MTPLDYLIDTSAFSRLTKFPRRWPEWENKLERGLVGVCALTEFEALYSAQSADERREMSEMIRALLVPVDIDDDDYRSARQVQYELTLKGQHRCAGPVDLMVAAIANRQNLAILHYDHDFEHIARITGQPTAWLAPPGSV